MIKCKHCEVEKPEDQMAIRAGQPSKVCLECKDKRVGIASLAGGGSSHKKGKRGKAATRRPKKDAAELALSLPAGGFGCNASITDEGHLQLTQENPDAAPDNVCLTRREARAIFETFGEWAAES